MRRTGTMRSMWDRDARSRRAGDRRPLRPAFRIVVAAVAAAASICIAGLSPGGEAAAQQTGSRQPGQLTPEERSERLERAAIVARANSLIRDRRYDEAVDLLISTQERFPEEDAFVELLAMAYLRAGRPLEAAAFLEKRLAATPGRFAFIRDLGTAFLDAGMPEKAVAAWHSILDGTEARGAYYCEVARLEWDAGMYDRAIETLREGKRFPSMTARCSAEILRLERMRGNFRTAFVEGLAGLESDPTTGLHRALPLIEAFRDAGAPADLVAAADSLAARGGKGAATLRMLAAVLRLEAGNVAGARGYLEEARRGDVDANALFQFCSHLLSRYGPKGGNDLEAYFAEALAIFVSTREESAMTARLYLDAALRADRMAAGKGAAADAAADRALAYADSVLAHRHGRTYAEQAALIRARILLERRYDPGGALEALRRARWLSPQTAAEGERLRMKALLAAGRYDEARVRFSQLASSPDSTLAEMALYGEGMALFYRGEFPAARDTLAGLAERRPSSEWANDALETAVLIKQAEREQDGPLDLLRAGLAAGAAGRSAEGADSLDALAGRYPRSVLAPRALFEAALLLERAGRDDEARERFERIADRYPLDRYAPRAMERLAMSLERSDPAGAADWYAVLIERYPQDPWTTRVRERYRRVREELDAQKAGGDLP